MSDPYASHLDVLKRFRPKRVLEFGAGNFSTSLFLSRPHVEQLVSIEVDAEWRERVKQSYAGVGRGRWDLRSTVGGVDVASFDLVFIDDGKTTADRVNTINWVLSRPGCPKVVIHDAEVPEYRKAIGMRSHIIYALRTPHTAVVLP